jgi:hypothetical protein
LTQDTLRAARKELENFSSPSSEGIARVVLANVHGSLDERVDDEEADAGFEFT